MRVKILKHAEIGMVENVVQNVLQRFAGVRVEQRLHRHAVREQKDDAHHGKVEQLNELHHTSRPYLFIYY